MTKIFALGVTGYIGGDALHTIVSAHPDYEITALVRNTDKGAKVGKEYPKVKFVYGDLDSAELIEEESKKADIVCNWASTDHEGAINAIGRGLLARDASTPGFYIHTSGTGNLMVDDFMDGNFGTKLGEKVYNDLEGVKEITSLPDGAPYRAAEKIVLAAGTEHADRLKTAIVCPPTIYGIGRGPDNQRSLQVPDLIKSTLQDGQGFQVNQGQSYWSHIHVADLSALYLKLVEQAAAGGETADWAGKPPVWGGEGYYFVENGEHIWAEVSQWVADEAKTQGLIKTNDVRSLSAEEAGTKRAFGQAIWGANSRSKARRARELLGWEAKEKMSLKDHIKEAVEFEAKKLGLKPGHAEIAAGDR